MSDMEIMYNTVFIHTVGIIFLSKHLMKVVKFIWQGMFKHGIKIGMIQWIVYIDVLWWGIH